MGTGGGWGGGGVVKAKFDRIGSYKLFNKKTPLT